MIIGITGKIASGKSSITNILEKKGYFLFDSDKTYHYLLKNNDKMKNELVDYFGNDIINKGIISRKILLKKINKDNIQILNSITHKYVANEIYKLVKQKNNVVIEAAIPVKNGFLDICDIVILSNCNKSTQIKRLQKRNKYSKSHIDKIIEIQMTSLEYINISDYIIETDNLSKTQLDKVINLLF